MSDKNSNNFMEKEISQEISMLYNISEIAQAVAYEINNPLMIIDGYTKKIKKNHSQADYNDLIKDIDAIKRSSERINSIVSNLLTYSKDNLTLPIERFPFSDLAQKAMEIVNSEKEEPNGRISIDKNGSEDIEVNFSLCVQAVINVIKKCISHSGEAGAFDLKLSFRKTDKYIELVIKDNGEKLSEEVQSQMFYQTFTTKLDGETLSMGMSSSFNIVKKFGGQLYFDNSYEENAFIFSFNSLS